MHHIQQYYPINPCFSGQKTDKVLRLCDQVLTEGAQVLSDEGSKKRNTVRRCKAGWLHLEAKTRWLFEDIWQVVSEVNDRTFQFEINEMESLQYLEYGPMNFFRWHTDNGAEAVARRKLTCIIQLSHSSDYWGGNLQIKAQEPERRPPRDRGSVVIFPSHLLHRATPVLLGTRKVLVAWIRGTKPLR